MRPNLKALLERLLAHDIDFVLVGGFAAVVHGVTVVTQDIDICAAITENEVAKLRLALSDLHPVHRMNPSAQHSFLTYPTDFTGTQNIYLKTDWGVLDILSEVPPVGDFEEIRQRAIELSLYGHSCRVISIEDLIRIKEAMNRPKDEQTATELRQILKKF